MMSENKTLFQSSFKGFHSSTLVQVIGNKSADLGLFFSQIGFGRVRTKIQQTKIAVTKI